ncbi:GIN domain-containing protein [Cellulomonas sp.]|uniref:GIN domain-containing protein n=1 Tax=Cellulomonas sp. TaxID=40001 RepID=UPI002D76E857|nr:DUF2807 domain-containing protein [Cellulomonas sp.]
MRRPRGIDVAVVSATVAAATVAPGLSACDADYGTVRHPVAVSEEVEVPDVGTVVLATPGTLTITRGEPSLTVTALPATHAHLVAGVEDGALELGSSRASAHPSWGAITYHLTVRELAELVVVDGEAAADDVTGPRVRLTVHEGAGLDVRGIDADAVDLTVEGRAGVVLAGRSDALTVRLDGPASLDAGDLRAGRATLAVGDDAEALVDVTHTLDVSVRGGGIVRYAGEPALTRRTDGGRVERVGARPHPADREARP